MDENKKLVESIFQDIEKPKPKVELRPIQDEKSVAEINEEETTIRSLLNELCDDYVKKLNIDFDLKSMGKTSVAKIVPMSEGLPFLSHSFLAVEHYMKHLEQLPFVNKGRLKEIREALTIVFSVCAALTIRIHQLPTVGNLDMEGFSKRRLGEMYEKAEDFVKQSGELSINNRVKWIGFLSVDCGLLATNMVESMLEEEMRNNPIAMITNMLVSSAFESLTVSFVKNMMMTSEKLSEL